MWHNMPGLWQTTCIYCPQHKNARKNIHGISSCAIWPFLNPQNETCVLIAHFQFSWDQYFIFKVQHFLYKSTSLIIPHERKQIVNFIYFSWIPFSRRQISYNPHSSLYLPNIRFKGCINVICMLCHEWIMQQCNVTRSQQDFWLLNYMNTCTNCFVSRMKLQSSWHLTIFLQRSSDLLTHHNTLGTVCTNYPRKLDSAMPILRKYSLHFEAACLARLY